jgi:hypothetical protein
MFQPCASEAVSDAARKGRWRRIHDLAEPWPPERTADALRKDLDERGG